MMEMYDFFRKFYDQKPNCTYIKTTVSYCKVIAGYQLSISFGSFAPRNPF